MTAYPDWHQQPFLLNRAEMATPLAVLTAFFEYYNLSQIRSSLKEWLSDAIEGREAEAASHFHTHETVAKLVEAAWVILEQSRKAKADEGFETVIPEGENEEEQENDEEEDDGNKPRFVKWVPFPASLKADPLAYMKRVFEIMELEGLRAIICRWQKVALAAPYERYDSAEARADLLDYCEDLQRLVEAAYILQRNRDWDTEGRIKRRLSEEMRHDLLIEEQTFTLSEEEINNPQTVVAGFFDQFSPPYARRELWDLLGCAVESKQENLKRLDLLLDYECLHAILEAAWLLQGQTKEQTQTTNASQPEDA